MGGTPVTSGGGEIHPAFASLNYVAELKEMVAADPSLFRSEGNLHRRAAEVVVAALLATKSTVGSPQTPRVLEPEAQGGSAQVPPQRDRQPQRFNLGTSLQEQDQIKAMLDDNMDRFAFSLEDINPGDFTGESMKINLNSDQTIFRPPHKLGQVE